MKIAIFSDVHGNASALRAVLAAIEERKPDRVFALGDLVGRGPEPEAVVRLIKKHEIPFIRGNWDDWVAGEDGWDGRPKRKAHVEVARSLMKAKTIEHLLDGPPTRRMSIAGATVYLAHGSPRDPVELIWPETSDEELRRAIEPASDADLIVLGHSHRSYVRRIDRTTVINTGTVGYPFEGDPRATFAWIELEAGQTRAEIVRVPYRMSRNLRALSRVVRKKKMPKELAERYLRALLGEGDELSTPPSPHASGVDGLLQLLAGPVRRAYGEPATLSALLTLRATVTVAMPALSRAPARRALRALDREIDLYEHLEFAEREGIHVRARRLRARANDLFPKPRRIRLGLRWLELAMNPRDRQSTIAELSSRPRRERQSALDEEVIRARWKKRLQKRGLGAE